MCCTTKNQGRAEDFRLGEALTLFAREILLIATPKFLSATPNFWLLDVALRKIRCGARKFRFGAKEIYVEEVIRLMEVKEMRRFGVKLPTCIY